MSRSNRTAERFSCETSRFLLPTFRRPGYNEIKNISVQHRREDEIFAQWTKDDGKYYRLINAALLNDDYHVLKQHVYFINNLRRAIQKHNVEGSLTVYRGLNIPSKHVKQEYKIGSQFLWPTFSCTSKNKEKAQGFGEYMFEIKTTENDWTYRADISKYSMYAEEEEVLFYPYSGFVVENIIPDAKVIKLRCVDTLTIEETARKRIPEQVKIFDSSRNMFVFFYKNTDDVHWSPADRPHKKYLIAGIEKGYWDAPYRYHHPLGYFLDRGANVWEEYKKNKLFARFTRVST
jgi:hypothetical protein